MPHTTSAAVRTALSFACLVAFSACAGAPPVGLDADLLGSSWTLERVVMNDGTVRRGDGDQVTFSADGALVLSSCNACSGTYSVRDSVLTVAEPLACTRRACNAGQVELERVLGSTTALRREGVYLIAQPMAGGVDQALFVPARTGG